jgi:hypothetical protein
MSGLAWLTCELQGWCDEVQDAVCVAEAGLEFLRRVLSYLCQQKLLLHSSLRWVCCFPPHKLVTKEGLCE